MRVAAAQAGCTAGDLTGNVRRAVDLVSQAAGRGAELVVLPEGFLTGYAPEVFAGPLPTTDDPSWLEPLAHASRDHEIVVVAGAALARAGTPGHHVHPAVRRLSLVLVEPSGRVSAPYDKQHLVADERATLTPGDHGTSLVVGGVEFGLAICYDGCFPEHARAAADDGALGYLVAAAYAVGSEHRRDLYYAARALDTGMYVVFAGLTGRCGDEEFSGGSAIYDPEGRPLARLGREAGVIVADLDPAVVTATRAEHSMGADRRADLGPRRRISVGALP